MNADELSRLAEEQWTNRTISTSTYCGTCGYNLRTLPYVYTCPECGNDYNARPLTMRGIFVVYDASFPFSNIIVGLFLGLIAWALLRGAFRPFSLYSFVLGCIAAVLAIVNIRDAYRRMRRWLKVRRIARRIAQAEEG